MNEAVHTTINWPALYVWLFVMQWLFNAGIAAWLYFRKADTENTQAVKTVADDLAKFIRESTQANHDQNVHISEIQNSIRHMPSSGEIAQLRESSARNQAKLEGMAELLKRVDHQTSLIHEHLLRNH